MLPDRTREPPRRYYDVIAAAPDPCARVFTRHVGELSAAVRALQRRWRLRLLAFVVLPERLHCIAMLPHDADPAACWGEVAAGFSARVMASARALNDAHARLPEPLSLRCAWPIHSQDELRERIARLHGDPVSDGLVARPALWPWSSVRREACALRRVAAARVMPGDGCGGEGNRAARVRDVAEACYGVVA